jgi:hypothetical protein
MNLFLFPFTDNNKLLTVSVVCLAAAFLITLHSFWKRGLKARGFFYGVAVVISGSTFYDIVYHYAFGSRNWGLEITTDLKMINSNGSGRNIDLLWMLMMCSVPLIGYEYMHLNRWFWFTVGLGFAGFVLWILAGYPQFFQPAYCSAFTHCENILIPQMNSSADRVFVGYVFNSFTKVLLLAPALLFYPRRASK